MTKKQILKALNAKLKGLEKIRDDLRDIQDEVEEQFDRASTASEDLACCIDKISEVV